MTPEEQVRLLNLLPNDYDPDASEELIHIIETSQFMQKREGVKAMIRTGEFTAYSSVILVSGTDLSKWVIENA